MASDIPAFYFSALTNQGDDRLTAPAADRNRVPVLDVLRRVLPARGTFLEIGSGTGQHVVHFASAFPDMTFVPTDLSESFRKSVNAWTQRTGVTNVRPPVALDVFANPWPVTAADVVYAANMLHVTPPRAVPALVEGAARILPEGGLLVVYGPFRIGGQHVAQSNVDFDAQLRAADPTWGVRDPDDLASAGQACSMQLQEVVEMPANNRIVIMRRG